MSTRKLSRAYPYLLVLSDLDKNERTLKKCILEKDFVLAAISEIVYNLLKENVELTGSEKRKLLQEAKSLLKLASKTHAVGAKYRLLTGQSGAGVLSTILTIGIPILSKLLNDGSDN
jgi:hypothetical protein